MLKVTVAPDKATWLSGSVIINGRVTVETMYVCYQDVHSILMLHDLYNHKPTLLGRFHACTPVAIGLSTVGLL